MTNQQQQQIKAKQRPSCRNALYLSLACSLLGVASNTIGASSFSPVTTSATPWTLEKRIQRQECNFRVRLFSSLPQSNNKKSSLQHPDQKQKQQRPHHSSNLSPRERTTSSSQLNSAATLTLGYQVYSTSTTLGYVTTDDPFDPNFRPPSWEDTWGPPPVSTSSAPRHESYASGAASPFRIFCDLDGVLCDFEHGVQRICRKSTADLAKTVMWNLIAQSNVAFFESLHWTRDGKKLWNAIRHLKPDILTGVPDMETARQEKFNWCRRHLGLEQVRHVDMAGNGYQHANVNGVPKACKDQDRPITNVITCWSYNKHHESGRHAVLIDDRIALKESWEAKGGIFVHHTDAETTLQKLKALGVPIASAYASTSNDDDDGDGDHQQRDMPMP
jgi:hypothetical protein